MNEWIEIFRGGQQTDASGRMFDGDWLIERAVSTFDPTHHEPPECIGHPKDNHPAYGWIEGLKAENREGVKILLAKPKDRQPEFQRLLDKKLYKKRSAAFYPDGRLRHVAYLGAMPPAVKGLADFNASDEDFHSFEFSENEETEGGGKKMAEKTYTEEDLKAAEEKARKEAEAEFKAAQDAIKAGPQYSEADLEKIREDERKRVEAEFSERKRCEDNAAFIEKGIEAGKFLPAWKNSGIIEFMNNLDASEIIEFSEEKKENAAGWFRDFMNSLGENPIFQEIATKNKAADFSESDAEKAGRELAEAINPKEDK